MARRSSLRSQLYRAARDLGKSVPGSASMGTRWPVGGGHTSESVTSMFPRVALL